MAKIKTSFFCSNCGYESAKWLGKCASCNEWNTFVEEVLDNGNNKTTWNGYTDERKINKVVALDDVNVVEEKRIVTDDELRSADFKRNKGFRAAAVMVLPGEFLQVLVERFFSAIESLPVMGFIERRFAPVNLHGSV